LDESGAPELHGLHYVIDCMKLIMGPFTEIGNWSLQVEPIDLPDNWRAEVLEAIRKKGTTNQGLPKGNDDTRSMEYAGLRFRSATELGLLRYSIKKE